MCTYNWDQGLFENHHYPCSYCMHVPTHTHMHYYMYAEFQTESNVFKMNEHCIYT